MNSMSLFVFLIVIVIVSSIVNTSENINENSSFNCEYLPNGCKFEQTYDVFQDFIDEVFVCNELDKRFELDAESIKK